MKDVVCWAASDFDKVAAIMKLDLHEPPMSQVRQLIIIIITQHSVGVLVKPRNYISPFFQEATKMIYLELKSDAEY